MLYGERHNENNPVIATNNDLLISDTLTTEPLSQNVPSKCDNDRIIMKCNVCKNTYHYK